MSRRFRTVWTERGLVCKLTDGEIMKQQILEKDKIYTNKEQVDVRHGLAEAFESGLGGTTDKLPSLAQYIARRDLSSLLAR